jgi:hypothetical protein
MSDHLPNFHDGHFEGFLIGPNKSARLFLRTVDEKSLILTLEGVQALALSNVKAGNIILDLVLRGAEEIIQSDLAKLYDLIANDPQCLIQLSNLRGTSLQILEINPSYGAQGLVLFENWNLSDHKLPRFPVD